MRIIPAIDIIGGKCVRLTKGDYQTSKVYNENPLEVAKAFEDSGIQYVHIVDLDGAKTKQIVNYRTLELIASKTNLKIDFGGGLKSDEDLRIAFNSGVKQVTIGSVAVQEPQTFEKWLSLYGSDKIILGADCENEMIAVNGWKDKSSLKVIPFIKNYQAEGVTYVVCTDISKDGMLEGPSFDLYKKIIAQCSDKESHSLKLIASGGVSSIDDVIKLEELGCEAVIIGKAIYENKLRLEDLKNVI